VALNVTSAIVSHDDYARQLISKDYFSQVIDVRDLLVPQAAMFMRALCQTKFLKATQKNLFRFFLKHTTFEVERIVRDVLKIHRQRSREFGIQALLQERDVVFNTEEYEVSEEVEETSFDFHFWSREEVGDRHRIGDDLIDAFCSDIYDHKEDIFSLFEEKYFKLFEVYNEEAYESGERAYLSLHALCSLYQFFLYHVNFDNEASVNKVLRAYTHTLLAQYPSRVCEIGERVNDSFENMKTKDVTNRTVYHIVYHNYRVNLQKFIAVVLQYILNFDGDLFEKLLTEPKEVSTNASFEEKAYFYVIDELYKSIDYLPELEAIVDDLPPFIVYHLSSVLYERMKENQLLPPPMICYHVAHYQLMNFDLTDTEKTTLLSILNEAGSYHGANVLFQKLLMEQAGIPFGFTFNQEIKVDVATILMLMQRIAKYES